MKSKKNNKTKVIKLVLIVLNTMLIVSTGLIKTQYLLDAFFVALIPVIGCSIILFRSLDEQVKDLDKRDICIAFILASVFMLMLSIEQVAKVLVHMDNEIQHLIFKVLFLPIFFSSLIICLYFALQKTKNGLDGTVCINSRDKVQGEESQNKFLCLYKPTWIVVLTAIYFFLAYFPGDPCSDVPVSIIENSHVFSDWHTVGWEMFMRFFVYATKNWTILVIAQGVLLCLAHNYAIGFLIENYHSLKIGYIYSLLNVTVGIMQFRYMVNMTKDTNFLFTMIFFIVAVMCCIKKEKHEIRDFAIVALSGSFASLFRHMSLQIVLLTIVVMVVILSVKEKHIDKKTLTYGFFSLAGVVIAYTILINIVGFSILKAEKNPEYVSYTVPMNVVGAMAFRNQNTGEYIPEDVIAKMELIMPIEKWSDCYCSYDADVIARTWHKVGDDILKLNDKEMQQNLISLNWYFLTHNPKSYLISFFDINSIVWEIATPADEVVYYVVSSDRNEILHMNKGAAFYTMEELIEYISKRPILSAMILRGGIAAFCMLFAFVVLILKKSRLWVATLSIVLYDASLMVSIPQANSRYSMPVIVCAILFMIVAITEENVSKR